MGNMRVRFCAGIAAMLVASAPAFAQADEKEELERLRQTTRKLIESLVEEGVMWREEDDALIREAGQRGAPVPVPRAAEGAAPGKPAPAPAVRVPYVPESVRQEIKEEIRQEVVSQAKAERWGEPGALPEWLSAIKIEGDIRVRYQGDN